MKKLIFSIIIVCMTAVSALPVINTNTAPTVDNIKTEVTDGIVIVQDWKEEISAVKKNGFSLSALVSFAGLLLISIAFLGVCAVILLNIVKIFTNDKIDKKIDKIQDTIDKYMINFPIIGLKYIRKIVKKK